METVAQLGNAAVRNKKRKAYEQQYEGAHGESQAKKVRLRRGSLNQLFNQPGDVIYEIFCHLEPLDLLHLSRTSKSLRAQLLSRSATSIWKTSVSNIPDMPECPDDISHPFYAELAFGESCHFCWRQLPDILTYWKARLRVCKGCLDEQLHLVSRDDRPYSGKLFDLLPTTSYLKEPPADKLRVFKLFDLALLEEFQTTEPSARDQWVADKIEERKAIHDHAHASRCRRWFVILQFLREEEKKKVFEDRQATVVERVKALGWAEELSLISLWSNHPENLSIVQKACNWPLTEQVLANLEVPLIQHMTEVRASRLESERWRSLQSRIGDLKTLHKNYVASLPKNSIYPTVSELFRAPFVQNIINSVPKTNSFTQDNLEQIRLNFPNLILWWRQDIELKLVELIPAGPYHREDIDRESVLNLATSVFFCSTCRRLLRHPEVLMHPCATKASFAEAADLETEVLASYLTETFWNLNGCITFQADDSWLLACVLSMANLNWMTATVQELNTCNPIFECVDCNDDRFGRATMTWDQVIVHFNSHISHKLVDGFYAGLVLLDESEAQIIRKRMAKVAARDLRRGSSQQKQLVCLNCKMVGSFFTQTFEHIHADDETLVGRTREQVYYRLDPDPTRPIYWYLPSRK